MDEINLFAETNFRNQRKRFGIKAQDRSRHMYIIGKTGTGKTTLSENMAIQDIQSGRGVGIVDPHGEFAEKMLDFVPSNRINDVIYFNPADLECPIAFNVIEKVDSEHRHLVASGLVGVFKKIWAETWGPRLEYVLRNAILALLEYPGSTLLGIMRMLTDKEYRKKIIAKINDPVVRSFWVDEFAKYPDRFMAEAVAPIQNKVGQFLTSPLIRNIVGQTKSSIDIRKAMDEEKILIMNLSKGLIGEDTSNLLGAMLITRIQLAAMSRVDIPENERKNFYLYVDEFQNFATEAFATILSEARKYRLDLILAHQYISQMSEEVRDAVLGNVGTMVCFRIGANDAVYLENEFIPEFSVQDLVNLDFAHVYLKLMIDGMASRPFSATTLLPFKRPEKSYRDKIIRISRERYASHRDQVEQKIAKWSGVSEIFENEKKQQTYKAMCFNCGKQIEVKFKPDGIRPVYCPECLEKARQKKQQENKSDEISSVSTSPIPFKKQLDKPLTDSQKPTPKESGSRLGGSGARKKKISLTEAMKQPPKNFKQEHARANVDLEGLRSVIKESLKKNK